MPFFSANQRLYATRVQKRMLGYASFCKSGGISRVLARFVDCTEVEEFSQVFDWPNRAIVRSSSFLLRIIIALLADIKRYVLGCCYCILKIFNLFLKGVYRVQCFQIGEIPVLNEVIGCCHSQQLKIPKFRVHLKGGESENGSKEVGEERKPSVE